MAVFDILNTTILCPRCKLNVEISIEAFFPCANVNHYNIGDTLINLAKKEIPEQFVSEGYAVCLSCEKDFFVSISIENMIIRSAIINKEKKPYLK